MVAVCGGAGVRRRDNIVRQQRDIDNRPGLHGFLFAREEVPLFRTRATLLAPVLPRPIVRLNSSGAGGEATVAIRPNNFGSPVQAGTSAGTIVDGCVRSGLWKRNDATRYFVRPFVAGKRAYGSSASGWRTEAKDVMWDALGHHVRERTGDQLESVTDKYWMVDVVKWPGWLTVTTSGLYFCVDEACEVTWAQTRARGEARKVPIFFYPFAGMLGLQITADVVRRDAVATEDHLCASVVNALSDWGCDDPSFIHDAILYKTDINEACGRPYVAAGSVLGKWGSYCRDGVRTDLC